MDDNLEAVLEEAEKHLEEGRQSEARTLLAGYLKSQPRSERAWWLMSFAVSENDQKIDCLNRVLSLNPSHEDARSRIESILQPTEPPEFEERVPEETWEVEGTEELEAKDDVVDEGEEAVTEDLGDFDTPTGDIWVEEGEDKDPAREIETGWQTEEDAEELEQEPISLWEDDPASDVQVESDSSSIWADELEAGSQAPDHETPREEEARTAAPGPGPGVYRSTEKESPSAAKKRGRSNRSLLLVILLIFFLVLALACVLLVLGFDLFQLGQFF